MEGSARGALRPAGAQRTRAWLHGWRSDLTVVARDGVLGVIQWEPDDTTRVMIDGYYSRFKSDVYRRGIRVENLQTTSSALTDPVVVGNAIVGGATTGIRTRTCTYCI